MSSLANIEFDDDSTGTQVFLLGAGCSKACGAPLMAEFMEHVRDNSFLDTCFKRDYEVTISFRKQCEAISHYFGRQWDDIEQIFTQAHVMELADLKGGKDICDAIRRVIWDIYRRPPLEDGLGAYASLQRCLNQAAHAHVDRKLPRPIIITTNYDTYLETAFMRCGSANETVPMYFYGHGPMHAKSDSLKSFSQYSPCAEIIKLHGSVNWFERPKNSENDPTEVDIEIAFDAINGPRIFDCQLEEWATRVAKANGPRPVIIPPTLGKITNTQLIRSHWKRAVNALEHAREIAVIGYSFPATDTFMSRLLAEGFRLNKRLSRVFIINSAKNSDTWWESLQTMFSHSFWKSYVVTRDFTYFKDIVSKLEKPQPNRSIYDLLRTT